MLTIIPFDDAYAGAFFRMNRDWITENFTLEPLDEAVLSNPRDHIIAQGGEIWFAMKDAMPIGCYALLHHADGRVEFTKFAVTQEARGMGAGSALLKHAIARARETGTRALMLFTNTTQIRACEMYDRYGFIVTEMSETDKTRYARANRFMVLPLTPDA